MNKNSKKIIAGLLATFQFMVLVPTAVATESVPVQKRKLMVTAYYSPLPDQDFYIRGSYQGDIRLNGRGTNGADGTEVYIGMLAAPRSYPFGTRIKIPGLGVGEVHDRGGAIVAGKDYDRIDVWMGRGEAGLARALNWGAPIVNGEVYFTPHQVQPGLSFSWVSSELPMAFLERLKRYSAQTAEPVSEPVTEAPATVGRAEVEPEPLTEQENKELVRLEQNRTLLAAGLGKDASGKEVENLQRMLWDLGYYEGEITGEYDQATIDAVFQFQIEHGVLQSVWDQGAGYFGKKTLAALFSAIERKIQVLSDYPKEVQVWVPAKQILPEIAHLEVPKVVVERQSLDFAEALVKNNVPHEPLAVELDLNDQSDEVVKLQNFLIKHGYLADGLNTGYFGQQTEIAVLKFQVEQGVVYGTFNPGAGRVGPQTLAAINSF